VKVDKRGFDQIMNVLDTLPADTIADTFPVYKKATPIRSGNARRNTRRRSKNKIVSNYGYAGKLDDGWSRQAPDGFTEPAIKHIEEFVAKTIRKL
tara:strand:- start:2458 stop:2742 length:285 start_codon:yes stop_codon:yes gene_type:complete